MLIKNNKFNILSSFRNYLFSNDVEFILNYSFNPSITTLWLLPSFVCGHHYLFFGYLPFVPENIYSFWVFFTWWLLCPCLGPFLRVLNHFFSRPPQCRVFLREFHLDGLPAAPSGEIIVRLVSLFGIV